MYFLAVLCVLVVVHELGHYYTARKLGVRVKTFAIGFGPTLIQRKDRHGCSWRLCCIPLGGYVSFFEKPFHPESYTSQSVGRRALIVLAGPVANLLFALLIIWMIVAYRNGIVVGSFLPAVGILWSVIGMMGDALVNIFTGGTEELASIIGIASITSEVAETNWINMASFVAILSINLGIVNLLPIPILDGGHLVMLTLEKLRGDRLSERAQMIFNGVGLCVILGLFAIGTFNDIRALFF